MMLMAAFVLLAVIGSVVNTGASVFVVYAAALAGRLQPVRRAVWVIIALAGVTGLIYLISQVQMPWRIMLVAPEFVFTLVVGAAGIFDAERAERSGGCAGRTRRSNGWRPSPSGNASHGTCTTCSATPSRSSC